MNFRGAIKTVASHVEIEVFEKLTKPKDERMMKVIEWRGIILTCKIIEW